MKPAWPSEGLPEPPGLPLTPEAAAPAFPAPPQLDSARSRRQMSRSAWPGPCRLEAPCWPALSPRAKPAPPGGSKRSASAQPLASPRHRGQSGTSSELLVTQSCPTLCDSTDCGPPGSSAHGVLQGRILEWVAVPFSRGSSQPRDRTHVSPTAGRFLTV